MFKDKEGNQLTYSEYMARWKEGMQQVTPLQQTQIQFKSTWISIVGLLAGIVITIYAVKTYWWLLLILVGALGNISMQQLGLWQKKKLLERVEKGVEDGF